MTIGSKVRFRIGTKIVVGKIVAINNNNIFPYLVEGAFTTKYIGDKDIIKDI